MILHLIRYTCLLTFLMFLTNVALAQIGNGGWLNLTHTQKLSPKVDLITDVQFRSANNLDYLSTLLLRSALSYNISKQHSVGLGYANITDWEMLNDVKTSKMEHRVFEQYIYKNSIQNIRLNIRARLEQRNMDKADKFSQRMRLQVGAVVPLIADKTFSKGMYSLLQSEVMFNVQNKDHVNGSFFDQHRPLIALGYRFNKKIDAEFGYLRWQQRKTSGDQERDIIQFRVLTNL
jgi:hypothetical protein